LDLSSFLDELNETSNELLVQLIKLVQINIEYVLYS
jgi:hypothetical protein